MSFSSSLVVYRPERTFPGPLEALTAADDKRVFCSSSQCGSDFHVWTIQMNREIAYHARGPSTRLSLRQKGGGGEGVESNLD